MLTTRSFEQKVRPHQGFRVAFIRHFLVPLDKHLHSEPALITLPLAAGPEESHRRNIHTNVSTGSTHNYSPGREIHTHTHPRTDTHSHKGDSLNLTRPSFVTLSIVLHRLLASINPTASPPPSHLSDSQGDPPMGPTSPHPNPCTFLLLLLNAHSHSLLSQRLITRVMAHSALLISLSEAAG